MKEQRNRPLQNQTRGSWLGSLYYDNKNESMRTEATYPTSLRWLNSRSNSRGSKRKGCWLQRRGDARGAAKRRRGAAKRQRAVVGCSEEATRCSWGAAQRHTLGTCHCKVAAVVVDEDATTMTKFFFVRVIAKGLKVINCLFVGDEVEQSQELAVDAARGSHTRWQESHLSVLAIRGTIVTNLVSSGAVK